MNKFERKNAELVTEFDRCVQENPEVAENIPNGALVAMQIEGDDKFNDWSRKLAQKQAEREQKVVFINVKKLLPVHSRMEKLEFVS